MDSIEEYKGYRIKLNEHGVFEAQRKVEGNDFEYEEVGTADTFKGINAVIDQLTKVKLGVAVIVDVNEYGQPHRLVTAKLSSIKDSSYRSYRVVFPDSKGYMSVDTVYKPNAGNLILMARINEERKQREALEAHIKERESLLQEFTREELVEK